MKFDSIEYLQLGSIRQRQAYSMLIKNQILSKLEHFDPILVGTIPINIDIENSDLDIICCFADNQEFQNSVTDSFSNERNFAIRKQQKIDGPAVVASFVLDNFEVEIFGQSIPTKKQFAYRHLIVEYNLLNNYGEKLRQQIIKLKQLGHKTEPAFGIALGLTGDPYIELLKFETSIGTPNG